jgi:uncharacterized protein (DUF697 family)
MQNHEAAAIGAICLMAAFADGRKSDEERSKVKEVFESLEIPGQASLYQKVLLGRTDVEQEARVLGTPELRQLAYEMAVSVCDADEVTGDEERAFLDRLSRALEIPVENANALRRQAETIAAAEIFPEAQPREETPGAHRPSPEEAREVDSLILKNAILCGGLELLPQSLSTVAIIPLQMRLVYAIGNRYGYQLDRGHVKELLATVGVGMTSQVFEGVARKFLGGIFKKVGGGMARDVAGGAAGAMMSFATTYALGRVAKAYYSGGRQLSVAGLKNLFQGEVGSAKELYSTHAGEIREKASTLDASTVMGLVTGSKAGWI